MRVSESRKYVQSSVPMTIFFQSVSSFDDLNSVVKTYAEKRKYKTDGNNEHPYNYF